MDQPEEDAPIFHKFVDLPPELRRTIWRFTLGRRIVSIKFVQVTGPDREFREIKPRGSPLPPSGYVNWESRHETLRFYNPRLAIKGISGDIFFNYNLDTLHITCHAQPLLHLNRHDLAKVQSLSLPEFVPVVRQQQLFNGLPRMSIWHDQLLEGKYYNLRMSHPAHRHFRESQLLLLEYFPSLREINILSYDTCQSTPCAVCEKCRGYISPRSKEFDRYRETIRLPFWGDQEGQWVDIHFLDRRRHSDTPMEAMAHKEEYFFRLNSSLIWAFCHEGRLSD